MITNAQFETELLSLMFRNVEVNGLGSSSVIGAFYISLHSSDPGCEGSQGTNEAVYDGYCRQPVERSKRGWIIEGNKVYNAKRIVFPRVKGRTPVFTHLGIGTEKCGPGNLILPGQLWPFSVRQPRLEPRELCISID